MPDSVTKDVIESVSFLPSSDDDVYFTIVEVLLDVYPETHAVQHTRYEQIPPPGIPGGV